MVYYVKDSARIALRTKSTNEKMTSKYSRAIDSCNCPQRTDDVFHYNRRKFRKVDRLPIGIHVEVWEVQARIHCLRVANTELILR